jgi:DNA-directed RNA polymerase alpha subunit
MDLKISEFLKGLDFLEKKAVFDYLARYFQEHETFNRNEKIQLPNNLGSFMQEPIALLDFSNRVHNILIRNKIMSIGQLVTEDRWQINQRLHSVGKMALDEIDAKLKKYGLTLQEKELTIPDDIETFLDGSIYALKLGTRASLGLINNEVKTIRQLMAVTKWELRSKFKNIGEMTYEEILAALAKCGLFLDEK